MNVFKKIRNYLTDDSGEFSAGRAAIAVIVLIVILGLGSSLVSAL